MTDQHKDTVSVELSEFQKTCLQERGRILIGEFAHFCLEWDFMTMDETCSEWDTCTCFAKPLHKEGKAE